MMGTNSLRSVVLSLYKRILTLRRNWQSLSGDPVETENERKFIYQEARQLFRRNKHLTDEAEIRVRIQEAEARLSLALHYRNPYPRPVNVPPMTYAKVEGKRRPKAQERQIKQATPVYMKSLDETN